MLQDTVDSILIAAANAIKRKNFLEENIIQLPKGTIVMHANQKYPVPYWHRYQNGKTISSRINQEEALVLSSQFRIRQCYKEELSLIKDFLKRADKQIQRAYKIQEERFQRKMPIFPVIQSENPYREEYKIHISARKEKMRSRAEILVSDALIASGLNYQYEQKLIVNGKTYYPDFTVTSPLFPYEIYIEYCGFSSPEYVQRQHQKILEYESGGIVQGINLLVIWENNGLLDASYVRELVKSQFTMERYHTVAQWLEEKNCIHT